MSSTISRVMSTYKCVIIIYLVASSPIHSSVLPKSTTGSRIALCLVLLRMGFTWTIAVTGNAVVSYTAFPPLPVKQAVYFCCTILGVTSTRRYLASCPAKPGLSSPAAFRQLQPRLSALLNIFNFNYSDFLFLQIPF